MRVTSTTTFVTMKTNLQASLQRVQDYQSQLASGKRLNKLSDDPADAVSSMRYTEQIDNWDAWQRNGDDAKRWLNTADGALQQMNVSLAQIGAVAVNAVNGSLGSTSLAALADQVDQYRDDLVQTANMTDNGRAVFAGYQKTAVTQVAGAWTYSGDNGAVTRQVGPAATLQVNLTGDQVFGFSAGPGQDLFSTLDKLSADIRAGNTTAISADQLQLKARKDTINSSLGRLGSLENRVDNQQALGLDTVNNLKEQRGALQDVDLAETILRLSQAQTGYQAALGAAAKSNMPSLASFLG